MNAQYLNQITVQLINCEAALKWLRKHHMYPVFNVSVKPNTDAEGRLEAAEFLSHYLNSSETTNAAILELEQGVENLKKEIKDIIADPAA